MDGLVESDRTRAMEMMTGEASNAGLDVREAETGFAWMPHAAGEAEDVGGKELPPVRGGNEEGKMTK